MIDGEGMLGASIILERRGEMSYELIQLRCLEIRLHLGIVNRACSALGSHGFYELFGDLASLVAVVASLLRLMLAASLR